MFSREVIVGGQSEHFYQLANELEQLVESAGGEDALRRAQRRAEIEIELIALLHSGLYAGPEARRSVRVPCRLGGRLRTSTDRHQVTVTNVSCGGAGVELPSPPEAGAEVELEILV